MEYKLIHSMVFARFGEFVGVVKYEKMLLLCFWHQKQTTSSFAIGLTVKLLLMMHSSN